MSLQIITQHTPDGTNARALANDVDVQTLDLEGLERIDLNFPKFTDGRAFSQAFVLRRRGFTGDIRAHGDVLIDQLLQMQRSGFSSAVLRNDQDAVHGEKLLTHYTAFYQGDALTPEPKFARVG
jgi:uncharacterized protein (DUF934 family)